MLNAKVEIKFKDQTAHLDNVAIPVKCPHCGKSMSPSVYTGFSDTKYGYTNPYLSYKQNGTENTFSLVLQCVLCKTFYINNFEPDQRDKAGDINGYHYVEVSYIPPVTTNIPEQVNTVSERFGGIYNQSLKAKKYGLNEIYGMGLRKALEFLVKDFAIYLSKTNTDDIDQEEKADEIKSKSLGQVINHNFSNFPDVIKLFKAAAWIGNDEAHYVRKHPDKDAEFLNKLIQVLANHVSSATIEQEALKLVDDN